MSNPTKQCTKCNQIKELDKFYKNSKSKDGLTRHCMECTRIKVSIYVALPFDPVPEVKVCTACKIAKSSIEFGKNKGGKDGRMSYCKNCQKIRAIKYANLPFDTVPPIKICKRCEIGKTPNEFRKSKAGKDGLNRICRDCARSEILEINYGISLEEYNKILEIQNGLCKICLQPETSVIRGKLISLAVDHCHKTKLVRGLLCAKCNTAIGSFRDNLEFLRSAIRYLSE